MKRLNDEYKNISLSHGTMRDKDLIPCFVEFLKSIGNETYKDFDLSTVEYGTDDANYLLNEELFEELNEIAPEGCYFGGHSGDSSDYGFWEVEQY